MNNFWQTGRRKTPERKEDRIYTNYSDLGNSLNEISFEAGEDVGGAQLVVLPRIPA